MVITRCCTADCVRALRHSWRSRRILRGHLLAVVGRNPPLGDYRAAISVDASRHPCRHCATTGAERRRNPVQKRGLRRSGGARGTDPSDRGVPLRSAPASGDRSAPPFTKAIEWRHASQLRSPGCVRGRVGPGDSGRCRKELSTVRGDGAAGARRRCPASRRSP